MEYEIFEKDEQERMKYFSTFIPRIEEGINKASIVSIFLKTKKLESEEISRHNVDLDDQIVFISEDGIVEIVHKGDKIYLPNYNETTLIKIPISEVALRQVDIIKRTVDKTIKYFTEHEMQKFKNLVDEALKIHKHVKKFGIMQKFIGLFKKGYFLYIIGKAVEQLNKKYKVKYIVCSRSILTKLEVLLYKYGTPTAIQDFKDGKLFNLDMLIVDGELYNDGIYLFPKDIIGYKDTCIPITIFNADGFIFGELHYGIMFAKTECMAIVKTDSIYKIIV